MRMMRVSGFFAIRYLLDDTGHGRPDADGGYRAPDYEHVAV